MDEKKISDALHKLDVPEPDLNAKKRAVNAAVHEFRVNQKKNEKNSQGFSLLPRLMGIQHSKLGRETMEQKQKKKLIYGGMATALAVVFIAGISFQQMNETIGSGNNASAAALNKVSFNVDGGQRRNSGGNNFSSIASNINTSVPSPIGRLAEGISNMFSGNASDSRVTPAPDFTAAPGTKEATPAYVEAIRDENQQNYEEAIRNNDSSIPIPIDPPVGRITLSEKKQELAKAPNARQALEAEADSAYPGMPSAPVEQRMIAPEPSKPDDKISPYYQDQGRDKFQDVQVNKIKQVAEEPVSTFSVDVDTASYSFMRRQINNGQLPAPNSIRVEELINYFDYDYAVPETREVPFKHNVSVTPSPWAEGKELVHIGIKGYEITDIRPKSNLVFLLDTSGSMNSPDKLPLVVNSLKMMLDTLNPDDTISIVAYAGSAGAVLEPTKVSEKSKIINALDNLRSGGSTAGGAGINLAYDLAQQSFDDEAVNRIILATDGDFNVGINNPDELKKLVEKKRESGIFLSVLGFGQGNYNDHIMQSLAQNGNGVAAYIDTLSEARKVLVEEASSSLFPIAKDVKIQIEFNPKAVAEYRLIGYETRALNREDFNNDKVDAGDIGAGHTVTAIYEITPVGSKAVSVDPLRYGNDDKAEEVVMNNDFGGEYAFLKMRYKLPNENTSKLITTPITADMKSEGGQETKFATAVSAFGQKLQGGQYLGDYSYDEIINLAQEGKGQDEFGYRGEFINMVRLAKSLDGNR